MADLTLANSGYQTGAIDTASTLVNNVSATDAQHINGPNSAALQIEAILGVGTDLKGSTADLVARLAVEHNSDGTQKTLTVGKGGTGQTSFTAGGIPLGNGTSALFLSAGIAEQVPFFQGSATASWTSGLQYQGPAQCGPSSAVSHGGTTTISVNQNLNGINVYDNLTIDAGVTVTVTNRALIILATNTITVNGTITGVGGGAAGGAGGAGSGTVGSNGTEQAGGGGGNGVAAGAAGGASVLHGITIQAGAGNGVTATAITGSVALRTLASFDLLGGAGGGGGGGDDGGNNGGNGGAGGASIILMAPTIVLGASSTLSSAGTNGQSVSGGGNRGGGGGGGAGHIYLFCRTITDSGATFTLTGGTGGTANAGGQSGGNGAAGVRQIFQYGE